MNPVRIETEFTPSSHPFHLGKIYHPCSSHRQSQAASEAPGVDPVAEAQELIRLAKELRRDSEAREMGLRFLAKQQMFVCFYTFIC